MKINAMQILSKIEKYMPWRLQTLLGYRPKAVVVKIENLQNAQVFYGNSTVSLQNEILPIFLESTDVPHQFLEYDRDKLIEKCSTFFCVRLYGSSFLSYEGYEYVIHNHSIIDPLTINWGYIGKKQTNHHGLSIYKYPKPKYLNGKTLLLSTIGATDCYGDWVLNLIPRIGFVEHFGFSLDQFDHILINPIKHNWQKELIEILNISHHNLIQVEPGQHYKCEEMIAPSYSPHSMFGYEYIKKRLCLSSLKQSKPRKKIFLTRKRNQWMRVINEDQLLPILQKHGFEVLDFNAMPLKQQIEIMLNTEFLISPEGSGLINSILLSADSKVIELFNKNKVNAMFHIFNLYNHNKYGALLCDEIKIIGLDKKSDIYVEPMQLDQLIQKLQD